MTFASCSSCVLPGGFFASCACDDPQIVRRDLIARVDLDDQLELPLRAAADRRGYRRSARRTSIAARKAGPGRARAARSRREKAARGRTFMEPLWRKCATKVHDARGKEALLARSRLLFSPARCHIPLPIVTPLCSAVVYAFAALTLKRATGGGTGPWRVSFVANWVQAMVFLPFWIFGKGGAFSWPHAGAGRAHRRASFSSGKSSPFSRSAAATSRSRPPCSGPR